MISRTMRTDILTMCLPIHFHDRQWVSGVTAHNNQEISDLMLMSVESLCCRPLVLTLLWEFDMERQSSTGDLSCTVVAGKQIRAIEVDEI